MVTTVLFSCEKEQNNVDKRLDVQVSEMQLKDGGDDDEEPIVQGIVFQSDSSLASGVYTEILPESSTTVLNATTANPSSFHVPEGTYYLRITPSGQSPILTNVFAVTSNVTVTVYLD